MAQAKAILFDAGNTLVFLDPHRVHGVFDSVGVAFDRASFDRAEAEGRALLARKVTNGQTGTERELWGPFFKSVLLGGLAERSAANKLEALGDGLRAEYERAHLWTWTHDGVAGALERLRDRGIRLGVITNADGRMESAIRGAGIRDAFDFVIDSEDVGVSKPDARIFQMAASRLSLEPSECVYVGDLYPVDVVGARGAGMGAVLVDPFDQFETLDVTCISSVVDLPTLLG